MSKGLKFSLRRQHKQTTAQLSELNREMALKLVSLASETGEVKPLIDAVHALRASEELFSQDTAQIDTARLQKKLGDILLKVGKDEHNKDAVEAAITAYRGAITIASVLGAQNLRMDAKKSHALAMNFLGKGKKRPGISLLGAA